MEKVKKNENRAAELNWSFPVPENSQRNFSAQVTSVVLGRQMGKIDDAYLKYQATLQEIKARIECCELGSCWGFPAKVKTTFCPPGVDQVTQLEFTPDGSHIIFGTSNNMLYLLDVRKLKNLKAEMVATSTKEAATTEHFKILPMSDRKGCLQEITEVFGAKQATRPGCRHFVQGIHCLEYSPNGHKILTSGHKSSHMKIIEVDTSRKKGDPKRHGNEGLNYNEYEAWTDLGVLTEGARNHGVGKITGGTWANDNVTVTTDAVGTLKVCRIHEDKILVRAEHGLHFPQHALPVEGGQAFPKNELLSTLVGVDKVEMRDEYFVTSSAGELYVLKADEKLGVTARGARREGIPIGTFHFTEQRKETKILCQTVDKTTGTAIVGTISGLTVMDTRTPHLLCHSSLHAVKKPKEVRRREMDQGCPASITAHDNIVLAGLYSGFVVFYDLRSKKWILEEDDNDQSARLAWSMGVQEKHGGKNKYYPNHYPLLSLKKHNGTLAVGGGPVYGGVARDRRLEGVLTLWE